GIIITYISLKRRIDIYAAGSDALNFNLSHDAATQYKQLVKILSETNALAAELVTAQKPAFAGLAEMYLKLDEKITLKNDALKSYINTMKSYINTIFGDISSQLLSIDVNVAEIAGEKITEIYHNQDIIKSRLLLTVFRPIGTSRMYLAPADKESNFFKHMINQMLDVDKSVLTIYHIGNQTFIITDSPQLVSEKAKIKWIPFTNHADMVKHILDEYEKKNPDKVKEAKEATGVGTIPVFTDPEKIAELPPDLTDTFDDTDDKIRYLKTKARETEQS
ncbi:MAG: hypothetical protein KJ607_00815, partial [Bacteroidetes bacterium]|nr:hypothetical protein [Bacteroidota bacterium]